MTHPIHTDLVYDVGQWSDVICPENTWVGSSQAMISTDNIRDAVGMYFIYFDCYDKRGNFAAKLTSEGYDMGYSSYTSKIFCTMDPKNFFFGYKLRSGNSNTGLTGLLIKCLDRVLELETLPYNSLTTTISNWTYCPEGAAVCGMKNRFYPYYGLYWDDKGHTDLHLHCCKICDNDESLFFDKTTKNCLACHYSCKTCIGYGPRLCRSCFQNDRLTEGSCSSLDSIL